MSISIIPSFKYLPLNHSLPSIRLLRVSADLSCNGLIQCSVVHITTDASIPYVCLSYVWGPPAPGHTILVNGKRLVVRQNLFHFLSLVQSAAAPDSAMYWIDAICIDQDNVLERNHQVSHMGAIYSNASCVHLWLGDTSSLAPVARICTTLAKSQIGDDEWHKVMSLKSEVWENVVHNSYWERAWVTQEVLLAQSVVVFFGSQRVQLEDFFSGLHYSYLAIQEGPIARFTALESDRAHFEGKSFIELLEHFHGRQCTVARDRLYSLFSLCEESADLQVDYKMPRSQLIFHMLSRSKRLPCLCSLLYLFHLLRAEEESIVPEDCTYIGPFLEFDCIDLQVRPNNQIITSKNPKVNRHFACGRARRAVHYENFKGDMHATWSMDTCKSDNIRLHTQALKIRSVFGFVKDTKLILPSNIIEVRTAIGYFPAALPVLKPARRITDRTTLGSPTHYKVRSTNSRAEYIRAHGFSARLNDNKYTYTVRMAWWAIASWLKTMEVEETPILCTRSRSRLDSPISVVERFGLDVRTGNGPWDLLDGLRGNETIMSFPSVMDFCSCADVEPDLDWETMQWPITEEPPSIAL